MGPDKCRPATLLDFTSALAPAGAAADAAARTILVSFDNRRLVAAKRALAKGADPKVHAIIVDQDEAAAREYATLRGLALSPRKPLSRAAARDLREAWNTWDDPELLADQGIRKGSWGHCIKIRMAMDLNPRRLAESTSGYAETPIVRAPSPESLTTHRKLAPQ